MAISADTEKANEQLMAIRRRNRHEIEARRGAPLERPRSPLEAADKWYTCEYCGQVVEPESADIGGRLVCWRGMCQCPESVAARAAAELEESQEEMERHYARRLRAAGQIDQGRYAKMTFDLWDVQRHPAAAKHLADVIEFTETHTAERNLLWLWGEYGTGKTHLALAALRKLLRDGLQRGNVGTSACYTEWVMHCSRVQDSWDKGNVGETEGQLWGKMRGSTILVIDDIDKRVPSEWAMGKLYEVIHHRHMYEKLTIVTANHSTEQLESSWLAKGKYVADIGGAIMSRITGQLWAQVEIKGGDQRALQEAECD